MEFTKYYKALAALYIGVENTTKPMDVHDSRPRPASKKIQETYHAFVRSLEEHYKVPEDTFLLGARKYIREAIPLSGCTIGYADEELDLAQMMWRQRATWTYGIR